MSYIREIERYGCLTVIPLLPVEMVDLLEVRSKLHDVRNELTFKERLLLAKYDLMLLDAAEQIVENMKKVYDFSKTKEPVDEWWWHLDLVATGQISFDLIPIEKATKKEKITLTEIEKRLVRVEKWMENQIQNDIL